MSKCDELKAYHVPAEIAGGVVLAEAFDYYDREPVDEAIAELKAENERLKNWPHTDNTKVIELLEQKLHDAEEELHNWKSEVTRVRNEKMTLFDEMSKKVYNEKMRADLAEAAETERKIDYDNLQKNLAKAAKSAYEKNNKQTLRALWLMTSEWADAMGLASCNIAIKLSVKERFFYHDEANREKDINKYRHRKVVFYKYGEYCRAKAEEYK